MASTLPALAIPGQRLGPVTSYTAGPGTHVQQSNVYASIAGPVVVEPAQPGSKAKATLSVSRSIKAPGTGNAPKPVPTAAGAKPKQKYNTLPAVDSVCLRATQGVNPSQTTSDNDNIEAILSSAANPENHSSSDELRFQALIRKEDVRAVEKDRVVMDEMFRVGDIVRGTVISLGDQSFYYLTTARNDLGVVMARSEAGNMMFPVSWKEMRDSVTGQAELRKVARPF
ncbi:exosome complex subunit Csl4 [Aspergillus nomiae NRRL 13137]|uniref:Exosome complex subunit Csl4 n=1 Tax=Aspergillus nomiae NRRL (strain ATCC 15546 / NRRL 13137 / CBS 260.88 / M93) TaxID=1509407 RepID=A0A0L1J694_ASPN3|nr:exosome complex subunit Csl4 [Aspergillus nomiae NRRL 13137]KNG87341.1 exosome complex subunit Csl4 [Aspergillus nomiae NRRL 13137]